MKTTTQSIALALLLSCPAVGLAQADLKSDPAYLPIDKVLDLEIARPEVNINLPRFLLNDAAAEFDGGKDDPLAATGINFSELIQDIKMIRVVVIEATEDNRAHIDKGVKTLRKELESKWTAVISVPDDGVGIYALGNESGEGMAGLAVLVQDDEDVVIANLVGRISLGKVVKIASQVNAIPPEVLEKLSGMSENGGEHSEGSESAEHHDSEADED